METPTEQQITLFAAVEDVQELTGAIVVLLTDAQGTSIAVAGDESYFQPTLREALSGTKLAEAGSVRELLSQLDLAPSPLNVAVHPVGTSHVLSILFDANADFTTVERVGLEARAMLGEILSSNLN